MDFFKNSTPGIFYPISLFFIISSVIAGEYVNEVFVSFLTLFILFSLFYRENEPPVIFAAIAFQWLSIASSHLYLIFTDATQEVLLWRPQYSLEYINKTYWLSIIGLLAFALGVKLAIGKLRVEQIDRKLLDEYSVNKVIILYLLFFFGYEPVSKFVMGIVPALRQGFVALLQLKWTLLFLMIYVSFRKNEKKNIVYLIIAIEILLGFTGYFSSFKDYLILFPIVYLSFNKIKGTKQITTLTFVALILLNFGVVWSYVKGEYRMFLSGGERVQKVTVDKQEALNKLLDLALDVGEEEYLLGFEAMVKRVYFLEYFSATVNFIPERQAYLEGETWKKSLQHIFMPRLFFPNKKAIEDSEQTRKLTGIQVAGAKQGTSISPGYMAESYADFGPVNMHIAIFVLGFLLGLIYKSLLKNSYNQLWGFALILPMYFLFAIPGRSLIKIFGDSAYFFLVFYFLKRFAIQYLDVFIRSNNQTEEKTSE